MIHCFSIGSKNIVLDVNSGALHIVDDTAFDVLKKIASVSLPPSRQCGQFCNDGWGGLALLDTIAPNDVKVEIRALIEAGQLFAPEVATDIHTHMESRRPVIKALCLHIAHECNLRCAYCFAGQGNYSETDRGFMSAEIGKKALDFLIENSGTRHNLEVDFFGGEPMLNFDVVKEIVAYGRSREVTAGKKFRFTLTTNGAFLSAENIEYINANFDNVVLSLDGRKHVNDHMRKFPTGGDSSYERILPQIKALANARGHKNYYIRGTYTRHNTDFAADVLHLADVGFKNISVEPVVAPPSSDYSIREEDLPTLFAEYEKLAHKLLNREEDGRGVFFFHFEMDITGGPCIAKRVTGCGAGSEYLAVTPSGKLYPCHQFVGDEKFLIGDVFTGIRQNEMTQDFASCHVFTKPECANCWAKFYCSGGCIATAHYANNSILKPDKISCDLMRKRIECALYVFVMRDSKKHGFENR